MSAIVLDASVVVKLAFEEEHSDAAARIFRTKATFIAPDLLWAEVANAVWKRVGRGEIGGGDAITLARALVRLPVATVATPSLIEPAMTLAVATGRSLYDSLYVALAFKRRCPLVTADKRLVNALGARAGRRWIRWLGDFA